MNNVLIYTTTCPEDTLDWDIFSWNEWLADADLPSLYGTAANLEACYRFYRDRNTDPDVRQTEYDMNLQKAYFYHRLVDAIYEEINRRKYPTKSVNEN